MDICLHLGAHRTGTTTFQTMLGRNRDMLRDAGIHAWGPQKLRQGMMDGLIKQPDRVGAENRARANASGKRIKREMSRMQNQFGARHLIISEENMIGTMTDNLTRQSLYPQAHGRLMRLAPAFSGVTRVALSVRSYDSYWASALAFKIKAGAGMPDALTLDRLAHQPRRWRDLIQDVAHVFPKAELQVMAFEQVVHDPAFILAAHTGMEADLPLWTPPKRCNASLKSGELADILALTGDDQAEAVRAMPRRFQPFNRDQVAKLRNDYAADLDWLTAGAEGLATFIDPTLMTMTGRTTPGKPTDRRGNHHDGCEEFQGESRMDGPGGERTEGAPPLRAHVA